MRLLSIDILRTVAIFMMVLVHFVENLASGFGMPPTDTVGSFHRWWLPTGLAAPLFTFLSGVSYRAWLTVQRQRGLTDEAIAKGTIRRGLVLFGLGLAFNVFIWLPEDTFNWDILTLIGSALILLNCVRRMPPEVPPVLIVLMTLLSPALQLLADYPAYWTEAYFDYDFTLADVLLGYLVVGYFPLFPWLVFPVAGFIVGRALPPVSGADDQPAVFRRRLRLGLVAGLLGGGSLLLQGFVQGLPTIGGWTMFPASTSYLLGMLAVVIASLLLLHRLVDGTASAVAATGLAARLADSCRVISRHSLSIYLLHHAIHIWPLWAFGLASTGEPTAHWRTVVSVPVAVLLAVVFCLASVPLFRQIDRRGWPTVEGLLRWLA